MAIEIGTLQVQDVIAHLVPKRDPARNASAAVTLSEAPMQGLDPTRRNFFAQRVKATLIKRPFAIVPQMAPLGELPKLIAHILTNPAHLVQASQQMAHALYNAQTQVNNPGLLTVMTANLGAQPSVGILKLQYHEAMQIQEVTLATGEKTFSAEILEDLTLTDDIRVFKASIFIGDAGEPASLEGLASDEQRGVDPRVPMANFFLSTFLTCELAEDARQRTRRFYDSSADYIETVPDPNLQIQYREALSVALRAPQDTISPQEFAETYLHDEYRQPYLDHLAAQDVPPTAFDKDTSRISTLGTLRMRTRAKITISGPAEVLNERVHAEPAAGDRGARIVIDDQLEDLPH